MDDSGNDSDRPDERCRHRRLLRDCPFCLAEQSPHVYIWMNA